MSKDVMARNSDKYLYVEVLRKKNLIKDVHYFGVKQAITVESFLELAPHFESVSRARRKIQELHPDLRSDAQIMRMRGIKANTKGTFIYNEKV
jgi:hypothetical protein